VIQDMGAPPSGSGSRPSGQANLRCPDASRFDPSRVGATEYDSEYVICPMCGYQQGDCWEWVGEDETVDKCPGCGGTIAYYAHYAVTYYTKAVAPPRDSDRSGEAGETPESGSTVGESAGPSGHRPTSISREKDQ
jgi:hypothetical protein